MVSGLGIPYDWSILIVNVNTSIDPGTGRQRETRGLISKEQQLCTCITAILGISLPFLHDYDMIMPNFDGERKQATTKVCFSF